MTIREQLDAIAAEHVQQPMVPWCKRCGQDYPCQVLRVKAAYDQLRSAWVDWLVAAAFPFDWYTNAPIPKEVLDELPAAYVAKQGGTVEEMAWAIATEIEDYKEQASK